MIKKSFLSLIIALFAVIFMPSVHAQMQTDIDGNTMNVKIREKSFSLFPRHYYTIEFFNNPQVSENMFTMRLASHGEISGCAKMSAGSVRAQMRPGKIKLRVLDPELRIDRRAPRYSHTDCNININRSFIDVKFDRDQLIEYDIKHIDLQSEFYGEFFTSDIKISEEKIELTAKTVVSTSLITFWFMPENTVVLHTPNSKRDLNMQDMIRDYGISQGLVPLEETFNKFELPYDAYNYVYFTNPTGGIVELVNSVGDNVEIGSITPMRTIHTANGPVEEPYNLTVHASVPGPKTEEK